MGQHAVIKKNVVALKGTTGSNFHVCVLSENRKEQKKHIWCAVSKEGGEICMLVFTLTSWVYKHCSR